MTKQGTRNLRSVANLAACVGLVVLGAGSTARADARSAATDTIGLAGGAQTLWVYQQRIEGQPPVGVLRLAFTDADAVIDAAADTPFRPPSRAKAVTGEVGVAAVLGDRLFIIFADGTHRSYDGLGLRVERKLPRNCVPRALAADDTQNVLWAVIPTSIAAELPTLQTQPPEAATQPAQFIDPTDGLDPPESISPTPTTSPALPDTAYSLVNYARGAWQRGQPAPDFFTEPGRCHLAVTDGQWHLLIEAQPANADAIYSGSDADGWTAPIDLTNYTYAQVMACGFSQDRFAVLVHPADNTDPHLLWAGPDRFEPATGLQGAGQAVAATWFGSHLALAFLDADDELSVGIWPAQGGLAEKPSAAVGVLKPRHLPWIARHMTLLAYGGLALVMLLVVARRRDSLMTLAALQPGQVLAPFSRRLLGFLLDLTLFGPLALYILWPAIEVYLAQQRVDPGLDRMTLYREMPADFFIRWLATVALFALYGTTFEGIWGATPGKRIVQCRVVGERGQPPRLLAVALRNFMRLVEMFPPFDLMPAAVLVILTRNRQRLGDLLARTVVVQIIPLPPDSQTEDQSTDSDD